MFLIGQESWSPDPCADVDCGEHGTCVQGICACDAGYEGEFCDALIQVEPCEPPSCVPYTPIAAGRLAVTGCQTYIGAHPMYPDELFCCSAPSAGSAPVCAPGDTPDIPCVVEYKFCEDGRAEKAYSPDPKTGYPGQTVSTSGSWTVDPDTGELSIVTTASAMGGAMVMVTAETYPAAFTYDNGAKLDLNSAAAVSVNEGGLGYYHRDATMLTEISGLWAATLDADMNTNMTVTASGYEVAFRQDIVCTPPLGMVCMVTPKSEERFSSGTHTLPLDIYITPTGAKIYQTDAARVLVFERQPDPCEGMDCGEHGTCEDGVCVCRDGYIGEFCDIAGPCVGIDCGEHGTCVEGICECDAGYEGDSCEVDSNECDPNPCRNGGSCTEGVPGTYECTCIDGFRGDTCEICPTDADGDGYGDPAGDLCIHPEPDCDDDRASVHPGAPELCDGIDNQCAAEAGYGLIDEGYTACGAMVSVPSGCFAMGDAFAEGWADELPVHSVCLSAFEMDRHEITNAEYAECVADGGCSLPLHMGSYSRASYFDDLAYADFPVIWMEWFQVAEYCTWAGKRLPTEAEWEHAARGGLAGKRFPWGDAISSTDANYDMNLGDTAAVESYPPNGYGLYDMAGNVWEWVADWYNENYYSVSPTNDPTGPATGMQRVMRGGSWDHSEFGLRNANRCDFCHADRHGNNRGGRCAR
jgi:formylglycine-generating enzyme required for sulfatase activity